MEREANKSESLHFLVIFKDLNNCVTDVTQNLKYAAKKMKNILPTNYTNFN